MTIDIRHVRIVLALAEEKNFTRAAARIGIPQPAISNQLVRIERILGMRIFARTTRMVRLTEEGERLLPHLVSVHRSMRQLEDAILACGTRAQHRMRIGLTMPQAISAIEMLRTKFGDIKFDVVVGESAALTPMLCAGELDAACIYLYPDIWSANSRIRTATVADEPVWALLARRHPLAGATLLRLAELRDMAWVGSPVGTPEHDQLDLLCRKADFAPRIAYRSAELSARIVALLCDDTVLGIGSPLVAKMSGLHAVPFDVEVRQRLILGWNSETVPDPCAAAILDGLAARCRPTLALSVIAA